MKGACTRQHPVVPLRFLSLPWPPVCGANAQRLRVPHRRLVRMEQDITISEIPTLRGGRIMKFGKIGGFGAVLPLIWTQQAIAQSGATDPAGPGSGSVAPPQATED